MKTNGKLPMILAIGLSALFFFAASGLMQAQCVSAPSGLIGWWPAEGNANDIVGGHHGTLQAGATFAAGEDGQAFSFSGSAPSSMLIPYNPNLVTTAYTVEAWVKPTAQIGGGGQSLIFGQPNGHVQLAVRSGTTGVLVAIQFAVDPSTFYSVQSTVEIPIGQFTHIAGTWNGTNLSLYLNGVLNGQITPGAVPADSGCDFCMGGFYGSCGYVQQFFQGSIDELSYYNRSLALSEIQSIYNAGSAGKCSTEIPPRTATGTTSLANGFLIGVTITDSGYGYTNSPLVHVIGGGGSGAQAAAVVSNGMVVGINVLGAGYGYTNTPLIIIDPPFIPNPVLSITPVSFLSFSNLTIGGAYQLQQPFAWYWTNFPISFVATNTVYTQTVMGTANSGSYRLALNPVPTQAFATPQVLNGFVVGATITSGGSGYVTSPVVSIVGGGGTNAVAVSHISGGVVTSIGISNAGVGYTNTPTIQIAQPPTASISPIVLPMMRVDSSNLAPYDNYQIQFMPAADKVWENWNGGVFSPPAVTNSQYLFITNDTGFFRLQYLP